MRSITNCKKESSIPICLKESQVTDSVEPFAKDTVDFLIEILIQTLALSHHRRCPLCSHSREQTMKLLEDKLCNKVQLKK
ncbi:unnamed protein product [Camellia sinensis]